MLPAGGRGEFELRDRALTTFRDGRVLWPSITRDGRTIAFVQIAGLIARRIKCDLAVGQTVRAGERFGIIRFGSRTDVYLPFGYQPTVSIGERVYGGVGS